MTLRRKNKDSQDKTDNLENLLVFGYESKIFRDDERAMFVDRGQHLIPWMGDTSIMIDRYDGRGHLYDLRPYDSELLDTSTFKPSDKEKALEEACDEERYLELKSDILEKQMYEEEEMKRLYEAVGQDSAYAAVGFNYDQHAEQQEQKPVVEEEEEDPYEVIPELQVPKGVNLPPTIKMHAIIEKTAAFIASQGTQMEIVIAAKQKNNPQFGFLNFGHELNVYYKHTTRMIQKGKYKAKPQEAYNKKKRERKDSENADLGEHGYLHPSLGGKQEEEEPPAKFLESVTAKLPQGQIANTAYAKLLSNLSKHTGRDSPTPMPQKAPSPKPPETTPKKETTEAKKKLQPPPAPAFLNKESAKNTRNNSPVPTEPPAVDPVTVPGPNQPPPPGTEPLGPPPHHDPHYPGYDYGNHYYHHYGDPPHYGYYGYGHHYGHHYGYGGEFPGDRVPGDATGQKPAQDVATSAKVVKNKDEKGAEATSTAPLVMGPQPQPKPEKETESQEETNDESDSESDDELSDIPEHITIPPREVRPIIDKMAAYVLRNGTDFELMMRKKNDERFRFLNTWHPHYSYYEWKLARLKREANGEPEPTEGPEQPSQENAAAKSVSFSIRPKEGDTPAAPRSLPGTRALLGDSDDEHHEGQSATGTGQEGVEKQADGQAPSAVDEKKQAEETLKNKLAVAAREKLVNVKEEGKLKAERKKKAAMFAALLQKVPAEKSDDLSRISSVASLASIGGELTQSGGNSPLPQPFDAHLSATSSHASTPVPHTSSPAPTPPPSKARARSSTSSTSSRSSSPSPVKKKSKRSRSRSRSKSKRSKYSKTRRKRSRSRSKRSSSRSRGSRMKTSSSRSRRSRSRSRHRKKPPPLPSAYTVVRRSSSPSSSKKRKSRSVSPSRHKRSRRQRSTSRSRRSRSKSPKRKRRSRSRSKSKSSSKAKKSKSKKSKRSHRKSPSRKKGKMVPIPELSAAPTAQIVVSSESSDAEAVMVEGTLNGGGERAADRLRSSRSRSVSPSTSEGEIKSPKPSEDLLSKVRAMLQAHKEILDGNG